MECSGGAFCHPRKVPFPGGGGIMDPQAPKMDNKNKQDIRVFGHGGAIKKRELLKPNQQPSSRRALREDAATPDTRCVSYKGRENSGLTRPRGLTPPPRPAPALQQTAFLLHYFLRIQASAPREEARPGTRCPPTHLTCWFPGDRPSHHRTRCRIFSHTPSFSLSDFFWLDHP